MGSSSSHQSKLPVTNEVIWITFDPNAPLRTEHQTGDVKIVSNQLTSDFVHTLIYFYNLDIPDEEKMDYKCISIVDDEILTILSNWIEKIYGKDWFQNNCEKISDEISNQSCEHVITILSKDATAMSQASSEAQQRIAAIVHEYETKIQLNNKLNVLVRNLIDENFTEEEKKKLNINIHL